eukprot:jgi/Bigna1/40852/e_gw1.46.45.1
MRQQRRKRIKIKDFRKGRLLGKGAFAEVHLGLELGTGHLMAVKSVPLTAVEKGTVRSFLVELNLLKKLIHPNVVRYLDAKTDNKFLYIFLEYVSGGSITSLLRQFGPLTEDLAGVFTRQILSGLDYLHAKGIAHRDIKGANILTTHEGLVKIADFGVSQNLLAKTPAQAQYKLTKKNFSKTGLHGTPPFMAPEVVRQDKATTQADVWSLGCTVIEMVTGKPPWASFHRSVPTLLLKISETKGPPPEVDKLHGIAREFVISTCTVDPDARPTIRHLIYHPFV